MEGKGKMIVIATGKNSVIGKTKVINYYYLF